MEEAGRLMFPVSVQFTAPPTIPNLASLQELPDPTECLHDFACRARERQGMEQVYSKEHNLSCLEN